MFVHARNYVERELTILVTGFTNIDINYIYKSASYPAVMH